MSERLTDEQRTERIKQRHYECFIEDHESKPWTPGQCADYAGRGLHLMRCSRRSGAGLGGLFCKQHGKRYAEYLAQGTEE